MDLAWCDTQANLGRAEQLITGNPGADVYVLPEMFTTGFCMEPHRIAEPMEGPALQWMKRMAAVIAAVLARFADGQI